MNKHKTENKYRGNTWVGLYQRKTKTKKEKIDSLNRKYKKDYYVEQYNKKSYE